MEINKILIANRGEIAVRIIRAARELGILTLAIYSDLDGADAYFCRMADHSLSLGGSDLADTYLDIDKIIRLAKENGAQAIHPGYGFLSENHQFAKACEQNSLIFIGPGSEVIRIMGNKIKARKKVEGLGIPVTQAEVYSIQNVQKNAENLGFPLLIKAAAGGGGKGMRIVNSKGELKEALETTSREASNYFGNGDVFLEKYIDPARHIEFQVLGDQHGNLIHVNERECSVQRRYQKIIEESPSIWLKPETRDKMAEASVRISKELGYTSAGTIEYLVDQDQNFYFLEMNTRIQVEHPVTERVSGIDLVREQLRIAQGKTLSYSQKDVDCRGHAIEARIYAEDPSRHFLPSPGNVILYREPGEKGVRVDSSMDGPATIHPDYDPMISKLIVWGQDRTEALSHLSHGLAETSILGIETNLLFLQELARDKDFIDNRISTQYCDRKLEYLVGNMKKRLENADLPLYIAGFLAGSLLSVPENANGLTLNNPWNAIGYWRQCSMFRFSLFGKEFCLNLISVLKGSLKFRFQESGYEVSSVNLHNGELRYLMNGEPKNLIYARLPDANEIIDYKGVKLVFRRWDSLPDLPAETETSDIFEHNDSMIVSPMYGKIMKINVEENEKVKRGDILLTIDSMKIENNILAPRAATIDRIIVGPGEQVEVNKLLLLIK